jgi:hypothetical protein
LLHAGVRSLTENGLLPLVAASRHLARRYDIVSPGIAQIRAGALVSARAGNSWVTGNGS